MDWRHNPFSYLLLASAVAAGALALYAWRRRDAPGADLLALFVAAVCLWMAGYAFELGLESLRTKVFWAKVEYAGIVAVPPLWFAFALRNAGMERWLTRRTYAALAIVPLVTLALVWTNEWHGLIWARVSLDASGLPVSALEVGYGAWFWVHLAYSYLMLLGGAAVVVSTLPRSLDLYRRRSWALLVAVAAPWLGNGLYLLGLSPIPNLDPTPFAFLVSGAALALALFRFRFLDLVPVARDRVVEGMDDAVIVSDAEGRVVDLNPTARRVLGAAAEALGRDVGALVSEWASLPEDRFRHGQFPGEVEVGNGEARRHYDVASSRLENREGKVTGQLLTLRDVTERRRAEEEIRDLNRTLESRVAERTRQLETVVAELRESEHMVRRSEERFRSLVRNASDIITVLEADGTIRYESPSVERVLGYRPEDLVGKNVFDFVHPEDIRQVREIAGTNLAQGGVIPPVEVRFRRTDGSWRYLEAIANNLLDDPSVGGIVVNSRDVTERRALEAQLRRQALHDPLTGLPNRTLFRDRLDRSLARAARGGETVALLFLDLDDFKAVNDSLGHGAGDELLVAVGERLLELLRSADTVARLGGDEFTVLLDNGATEDEASRTAERILRGLKPPFTIRDHELTINASIGVAVSAEKDQRPEDLLRRADLALYRAKRAGKRSYVLSEHDGSA